MAYLGPSFAIAEIAERLRSAGADFRVVESEDVVGSEDALVGQTVDPLTEEKAVGWLQGRTEFGPRALVIDRYSVTCPRFKCNDS